VKALPGLKVAIVWQGDPKYGWDRFRSIPLKQFAQLAAIPGVTLVSVQRGYGEEQIASASFPLHVFDPPLDNATTSFMDTAAVLTGVDLVISIDSAVAHLSGGLGAPTWLLVDAATEWRWGLQGDRPAWYPSIRLFRQQKLAEWDEVFQRVAQELAALAAERNA
jgi:ADP-heptose:LPS heptosyltransferase